MAQLHVAHGRCAFLHFILTEDLGVETDPRRRRTRGLDAPIPWHPATRCDDHCDRLLGHHGADLQLPAVHDIADLCLSRSDRLPPPGGIRRSLRKRCDDLPQGDPPTLDARGSGRNATDLHPCFRRLHQCPTPGKPGQLHDRQCDQLTFLPRR